MSKPTRVPFGSNSTGFAKGSKQGIKSPAGKPSHVANTGMAAPTFGKGVRSKAQVTGITKAGQKSVSGGKVGKTSKG